VNVDIKTSYFCEWSKSLRDAVRTVYFPALTGRATESIVIKAPGLDRPKIFKAVERDVQAPQLHQ